MVQAKAAEGKSPQRLFSLNREEPSRRKVGSQQIAVHEIVI